MELRFLLVILLSVLAEADLTPEAQAFYNTPPQGAPFTYDTGKIYRSVGTLSLPGNCTSAPTYYVGRISFQVMLQLGPFACTFPRETVLCTGSTLPPAFWPMGGNIEFTIPLKVDDNNSVEGTLIVYSIGAICVFPKGGFAWGANTRVSTDSRPLTYMSLTDPSVV